MLACVSLESVVIPTLQSSPRIVIRKWISHQLTHLTQLIVTPPKNDEHPVDSAAPKKSSSARADARADADAPTTGTAGGGGLSALQRAVILIEISDVYADTLR